MNFINLIKFPLLIKFELYQQASVYHLEKVGFWTMLREKNVTLSDNARVSEKVLRSPTSPSALTRPKLHTIAL